MALELPGSHQRGTGLVDVLDRVLDKGLVIAGDIKVSLAEVELLTIRIRLLVCSIDKAEQIGLDWWSYDRHLSPGGTQASLAENEELRAEIARCCRSACNALTTRPAGGRRAGADSVTTRRGLSMAVERAAGGTSLIDVLDRVLDKGIVIDAWVRVSLVGIDLITVEARVVVASIDTYLKYSEAVGQVAPVSRPAARAPSHEEVMAENAALRAELAGRRKRARTRPPRRRAQARGARGRGLVRTVPRAARDRCQHCRVDSRSEARARRGFC